MNIYVLKL